MRFKFVHGFCTKFLLKRIEVEYKNGISSGGLGANLVSQITIYLKSIHIKSADISNRVFIRILSNLWPCSVTIILRSITKSLNFCFKNIVTNDLISGMMQEIVKVIRNSGVNKSVTLKKSGKPAVYPDLWLLWSKFSVHLWPSKLCRDLFLMANLKRVFRYFLKYKQFAITDNSELIYDMKGNNNAIIGFCILLAYLDRICSM